MPGMVYSGTDTRTRFTDILLRDGASSVTACTSNPQKAESFLVASANGHTGDHSGAVPSVTVAEGAVRISKAVRGRAHGPSDKKETHGGARITKLKRLRFVGSRGRLRCTLFGYS